MSNALLVLNAGSSSIKFSVFQAGNLDPLFGGRVTGIGTAPHLVIRDASGATLDQQTPADAAGFDHAQALGLILEQIDRRLDGDRIVGAGHRVVHGGIAYATPVRIDPHV
ncbi:MAG: hypothetical protein SFV23_06550, partial [Planctomycetaceae bacterium]|nr:hypothetical protein [Planctomycetaceae bacterium]